MPTAPRRVLVVDSIDETRLLLCDLLDRTGLASASSDCATEALSHMKRSAFDAIVIDADSISVADWTRLLRSGTGRGSAIVVAGTNRPESSGVEGVSFVRKPYHYRELVHRIWAALEATDTQARAAA